MLAPDKIRQRTGVPSIQGGARGDAATSREQWPDAGAHSASNFNLDGECTSGRPRWETLAGVMKTVKRDTKIAFVCIKYSFDRVRWSEEQDAASARKRRRRYYWTVILLFVIVTVWESKCLTHANDIMFFFAANRGLFYNIILGSKTNTKLGPVEIK